MGDEKKRQDIIREEHIEKIKGFSLSNIMKENVNSYIKHILDHTSDLVAITNLEGVYLYVSPSHRALGYDSEELVGKSGFDYLHPDDIMELMPFLDEALTRNDPRLDSKTVEFRIRDIEGNWQDLESTVNLVRDEDGNPLSILFISRDVSERKAILRSLKESEEKYRLLAENALEVIWTADMEFNFTYISPSVEQLRGYTPEEAMALPFEETITPESLEWGMIELLEQLAKPKEERPLSRTVEMEQFCKDGSTVWTEVTIRILADEEGNDIGLQGVTTDITERKKAEKEIKQSEEKYRLLAENAAEVIWTMDMEMNFTYISPSVEQLRGYTPEEAMAMSAEETFTPESFLYCLEELGKELLRPQEDLPPSRAIELEQTCKDGSTVWTEVTVKIITDEKGNISGLQGSTVDITERMKAQKELEEHVESIEALNKELIRANRIKDMFLANTSHELRTPLNSMMGVQKLILDGLYKDQDELMEFVGIAHQSSKHLLTIINDILDIAKIESGNIDIEYSTVEIDLLFGDIYNMFNAEAQKKHIELIIDHPPKKNNTITSDEKRLKQVLTNLIGNSLKFTEQGAVRVFTNMEENGITFVVQDTGIGIESDKLEEIFKPFFQLDGSSKRKRGGTGLGLSICKNLVEAMGGQITIESKGKNKGTKVSVFLPKGKLE